MSAQNAARKNIGAKQKSYRISPKVTVTRRKPDERGKNAAFVKHTESGRLWKLGREELFLLTELDAGHSPPSVVQAFEGEFGKAVRPDIVDSFARQMAGAGVLTVIEDAVVEEAEGPKAPPKATPTPTQPEAEIVDEVNDVSDGPAGDSMDDEMRHLEDLVFGSDTPDARRKPNRIDPPKPTPSGSGATDGTQTGAKTNPEQTDTAADAQSDGAQSSDGETERSHKPRFVFGSAAGNRAKTTDDAKDTAKPNTAVATGQGVFGKKPPKAKKENTSGMFHLFNPTWLLSVLSATFGWWRHVSWLIYPLSLFAILAVFHRLSEYVLSLAIGRATLSTVGFLMISFVTVNLLSRLITGVVAYRHGAKVKHFGLVFILFIIPRFAIDLTGVNALDKEGKLAVYAASLKSRLFIFSLATIVWANARQSGTMIPEIAVITSVIAMFTFLIGIFPLLQGDGYKWMSTYFDQPFLRQRAYYYVFGTSKKIGQLFPDPTPREKWAFGFYAVGSALITAVIVTMLVAGVVTALEGRFGGTGLIIFIALVATTMIWLNVMKASQMKARKAAMKDQMADKMAERKAAAGGGGGMMGGMMGGGGVGGGGMMGGRMGGGGMGGLMGGMGGGGMMGGRGGGGEGGPLMAMQGRGGALAKAMGGEIGMLRGQQNVADAEIEAPKVSTRWFFKLVIVAALTAFSYIVFLPYNYDVGGDFSILPDARSQVNAKVAGALVEISVAEGDVVQAGDVLARLSDVQPRFQVASAEAELTKARSRLQKLYDGTPEEDINVAREQVAAAEADLPFAQAQAERAETLLERGAISETDAERFRKAYSDAQQNLSLARANLEKVEAPSSDTDIAIAEAEVAKIEAQLQYAKTSLEGTTIVAPVTGRVVTENVSLVLGKYLDVGELFLEIENHEIARAEVSVSEADVGLVEIGDEVRLKAWSTSEEERIGTVIALAPVAEDHEHGRIVRVKTQFDNSAGFYRPGMTGFAKIDGGEMETWRAFTRLFDRFFRIEVWGWIP